MTSAAIRSGIDLSYIDENARPQDDLFGHVNGRWLTDYDIPAEAFEEVASKIRGTAPFVILDLPHLWTGWMRKRPPTMPAAPSQLSTSGLVSGFQRALMTVAGAAPD